MQVVMLDARDEDIELFKGNIDDVPSVDDSVVLENNDSLSGWSVTSRTFLMKQGVVVILMHPINQGEWDGSANSYVEALERPDGS